METDTSAPRKCHVLIVDDNVALTHFFEEILKLHGYDVTVVTDGVLALKHALHNQTDAVICDLQMPQVDGDLLYAAVHLHHGGGGRPEVREIFQHRGRARVAQTRARGKAAG